MVQYTDAPVTIILPGYEMTKAQMIHVTFEQNDEVVFDIEDVTVVDDETLFCRVSQEQSGMLSTKVTAKCQVNWLDEEGYRSATVKKNITVSHNMLGRVIHANSGD